MITDTLRDEIHHLEPLIWACEQAAESGGIETLKRAGASLSRAVGRHLGGESELLRAVDGSIAVHQGPLQVLTLERGELLHAFDRLARTSDLRSARSWLRYAAAVARQICADEERELLPLAEEYLRAEVSAAELPIAPGVATA